MDLSYLTDKQLMIDAKAWVKHENGVMLKVLHHIKESSRSFADYRLPGLLELVMKELGYSRDQALSRMKAMRMMRENPIVEEKIESGELNLTTLGIVEQLCFLVKKKASLCQQNKRPKL